MRHFATVFDKKYLFQGLALYESLRKFSKGSLLHVLCLDDETHSILSTLALSGMMPVSMSEVLSPELVSHRDRTTYAQFCWSCQPIICEYVLDDIHVNEVTYVEADSLFFSSPEPLFSEMDSNSVTVSPHLYHPKFDKSETSGLYCTQFNCFKSDRNGRSVLLAWKNLCYQYSKEQLFEYPGQKGMDGWPSQYVGVHILKHIGAGVAPWNISKYKFSADQDGKKVDGVPIIFFHFHSYARSIGGDHYLGAYPIRKKVIRGVYAEYVRCLRQAKKTVNEKFPHFDEFRLTSATPISFLDVLSSPRMENVRRYASKIKAKLCGSYNFYSDSYFL